MSKILITGGTGLVGAELTKVLIQKGYEVVYLSRKEETVNGIKAFKWDIETDYLDPEALNGVEHIIHLAGANVAEGRWTEKRKKVILESRIKSADLLFDALSKNPNSIKTFISASAVGYYGSDTGSKLLDEDSVSGNDFLAGITRKWEMHADKFEEAGIRVVKIRIGVVLSKNGGALPQLAKPVKFGLGVYIGSGHQYMSWIQIEDLAAIFIKALEDDTLMGPYNAVAPNPVTNKEFTKGLAVAMKKWMLSIYVPSFLLKLAMGEMSVIVTGGNNVSCKKILETGFQFKYRTLESSFKFLVEG